MRTDAKCFLFFVVVLGVFFAENQCLVSLFRICSCHHRYGDTGFYTHRDAKVVTSTTLYSLDALKVILVATSSPASYYKIINVTAVLFHCTYNLDITACI